MYFPRIPTSEIIKIFTTSDGCSGIVLPCCGLSYILMEKRTSKSDWIKIDSKIVSSIFVLSTDRYALESSFHRFYRRYFFQSNPTISATAATAAQSINWKSFCSCFALYRKRKFFLKKLRDNLDSFQTVFSVYMWPRVINQQNSCCKIHFVKLSTIIDYNLTFMIALLQGKHT